MVVAVLGAGGQVGQALQYIAKDHPGLTFHFFTSKEIDITQAGDVAAVWREIHPDYCINAAAYTAVDKAESEPEKARQINAIGPENLAKICKQKQTTLLHVSTDFVFDGTQKTPYKETDLTHPISQYGQSKLEGELAVMESMEHYFIIRTSWVYSQFGNNFMKTMLRLAGERNSLNVVDDQIGSPTHAIDLAKMLLFIIESNSKAYGIYHFCNQGSTSWYGFAKAIFEQHHLPVELNPISTANYPTPAQRPANSVLDTTKIRDAFQFPIQDWKEAMKLYS